MPSSEVSIKTVRRSSENSSLRHFGNALWSASVHSHTPKLRANPEAPALINFSTKSAEPHIVALKSGVRPSWGQEQYEYGLRIHDDASSTPPVTLQKR